MTTQTFAYSIVPTRQDQRRLVSGVLYHVQTVNSPGVAGKSDLEVILRDMTGSVVWRGPYLGSDSKT